MFTAIIIPHDSDDHNIFLTSQGASIIVVVEIISRGCTWPRSFVLPDSFSQARFAPLRASAVVAVYLGVIDVRVHRCYTELGRDVLSMITPTSRRWETSAASPRPTSSCLAARSGADSPHLHSQRPTGEMLRLAGLTVLLRLSRRSRCRTTPAVGFSQSVCSVQSVRSVFLETNSNWLTSTRVASRSRGSCSSASPFHRSTYRPVFSWNILFFSRIPRRSSVNFKLARLYAPTPAFKHSSHRVEQLIIRPTCFPHRYTYIAALSTSRLPSSDRLTV